MTERARLRSGEGISSESCVPWQAPFFCYTCGRELIFVPQGGHVPHFRHYPEHNDGEDPKCQERVHSFVFSTNDNVHAANGSREARTYHAQRPPPPESGEDGGGSGEGGRPRVLLRLSRSQWYLCLELPPLGFTAYSQVPGARLEEVLLHIHRFGSPETCLGSASYFELRPSGPGKRLVVPPSLHGYSLTLSGMPLAAQANWQGALRERFDGALFRLVQGDWVQVRRGGHLRWGEQLILVVAHNPQRHYKVKLLLGSEPVLQPLSEAFDVVGPIQLPDQEEQSVEAWLMTEGYLVAHAHPRLKMGSWPWSATRVQGGQELIYPLEEDLLLCASKLPRGHPLHLQLSGGAVGAPLDWALPDQPEVTHTWHPTLVGRCVASLEPDGSCLIFHCLPLPSAERLKAALAALPRLRVEVGGAKAMAFSPSANLPLATSSILAPCVKVGFEGKLPEDTDLGPRIRVSATLGSGRYVPPMMLTAEQAGRAAGTLLGQSASRVVLDAGGFGRVVLEPKVEGAAPRHRLTHWAGLVQSLGVVCAPLLVRAMRAPKRGKRGPALRPPFRNNR